MPNLSNMDYLNIEWCNNIKNKYILKNIKEICVNNYSIYDKNKIINSNIIYNGYYNY